MGLEVATYISGLVATNPVGATDPKSQGDDHLRLIKATLLATFPNITGALTVDQGELNLLDGIGGFTGTGSTLVKNASPTFTGTITAAGATFSSQVQFNSAGVGPSNSSVNISSGTPYLNFTETDQAADSTRWVFGSSAGVFHIGPVLDAATVAQTTVGLHLTRSGATLSEIQYDATAHDMNGTLDVSGNAVFNGTVTIGGVLASDYARLSATNSFTAVNTLVFASAHEVIQSSTATPAYVQFNINGANTKGYVGVAGATNDLITGSAANDFALRSNSGNLLFSGNDGTSIHFKLSAAGVLTTLNADAGEVGYKGLPTATDETPILTDTGKMILATGNVTIPANSSVAYPVGTVITVVNNTASTLTIAVTTDTLRWAGTGGTDGTRTLASHQGVATLVKASSTLWVISGNLS